MVEISSIRVSKETKKRLSKLGNTAETFDELLNAMASFIEQNENDWWEEEPESEGPESEEEEPESEEEDPKEPEGIAS